MNIGIVSEKTGVPAKTIRYYEEIGLISAPIRSENGYRYYQAQDIETLRFVQRARGLGFSVKDVGNLLTLWQDKNRASSDVKNLAIKHIRKIEDKIKELDSIRETLINLTNNCHGNNRPDCPILNGLTKL
jgi:Cu(I)-responsive transcriptional regulator